MPFSPKRLSGPDNPVSSVLLTVPTGHKYQVTQIHMVNISTVVQRVQVVVAGFSSNNALFWFDGTSGENPLTLRPGQAFDWNCNLTLEAAELLLGAGAPASGVLANTITFTVEGFDWYM